MHLSANEIKVVISDEMMPGMSGSDFLAKVRIPDISGHDLEIGPGRDVLQPAPAVRGIVKSQSSH